MKNKILLFAALILTAATGFSQGSAAKFGYVDTDYIMSQIPEYKAAQNELDKTSV